LRRPCGPLQELSHPEHPLSTQTRPRTKSQVCPPLPLDISPEQREILDDALRVDLAGEIAASWIYRGQITVLGRDPRVDPLIQVSHLETAIQPLSIDLIWRRKCKTRRNKIRKSWINCSHKCSGTTNNIARRRQGCGFCTRGGDGPHEQRGSHGLQGVSGNNHKGAL
jgi:hypothetical protein